MNKYTIEYVVFDIYLYLYICVCIVDIKYMCSFASAKFIENFIVNFCYFFQSIMEKNSNVLIQLSQ